MVYDPAWDMPRANWLQQGSFETGEIPLAYDPDAGPLVCLPPINVHWLPLILGCLDQLRNPSTWITSSDSSLNIILDRANRLMQMVGGRADCVSYQLQFTSDCKLQFSTDGGTTWSDVSGWDDNFHNCVSSVIIPPVPPNPRGDAIAQHACNMAGFVANEVIKLAITQAVTDFNSSVDQVGYAVNILGLIAWAFPITYFALDAFYLLYSEYNSGTISDFTFASTDPTLWEDVTCAISNATASTGYISAGNLPAVIANICAIDYVYSDVVTALCNFISNVGLQNLQAMQSVGAVDVIDCTACSTWCYIWNGASHSFDYPPWVYTYGIGVAGHPAAGVGAQSDAVSGSLGELAFAIPLNPTPGVHLTYAEVHWTADGANPFSSNVMTHYGGTFALPNTAGSHTYIFEGDIVTNEIGVDIAARTSGGGVGTVQVTYWKLKGWYVDPGSTWVSEGAITCAP